MRELLAIIARHAFHHDVDAQRVQSIGDEQRVRVDAKRRQQFAANGDDRRARQRRHASHPTGVIHINARMTRLP
jgi:hypothetical protein